MSMPALLFSCAFALLFASVALILIHRKDTHTARSDEAVALDALQMKALLVQATRNHFVLEAIPSLTEGGVIKRGILQVLLTFPRAIGQEEQERIERILPDLVLRVMKKEKNLPHIRSVVLLFSTHSPMPQTSAKSVQPVAKPSLQVEKKKPRGVKHVIPVMSGKGGVGKSTMALHVALGFQRQGLRVGFVDADIYGPSLAAMLPLQGHPELTDETPARMEPLLYEGMQTISIAFLLAQDDALIWRGPMVQSALLKLMFETYFTDVDVLVIDMPPGTGDIHLSLLQRVPLSGAVLVSTPQDMAVRDAKKGVLMLEKLGVPILGVIQNMDGFGKARAPMFQGGALQELVKQKQLKLLASIPFLPSLAASMEQKNPHAALEDQEFQETLDTVCEQLLRAVGVSTYAHV